MLSSSNHSNSRILKSCVPIYHSLNRPTNMKGTSSKQNMTILIKNALKSTKILDKRL